MNEKTPTSPDGGMTKEKAKETIRACSDLAGNCDSPGKCHEYEKGYLKRVEQEKDWGHKKVIEFLKDNFYAVAAQKEKCGIYLLLSLALSGGLDLKNELQAEREKVRIAVEALGEIKNCLGPKVPEHCAGCSAEMGIALKRSKEALAKINKKT